MTAIHAERRYDAPASRWAGVGPYYAMFPANFSNAVIQEYTRPGDWVLDPFAGRGTTLFSAATQGRFALGVEINPVGWVYGQAKLQTAKREDVENVVRWLGQAAPLYRAEANELPEFFKRCYCATVREFLVAARSLLDWRRKKAHWTAMALLLIDLHGKRECALSNQMRQTKAMSPQYAIRWWQERRARPPERDPVQFMLSKIAWRYGKGHPEVTHGKLYLGDSRIVLNKLCRRDLSRAQLLLTSPPYSGVTNYFYDQWLRLWLLGGPSHPHSLGNPCMSKFRNHGHYENMLRSVFLRSKRLLAPGAVVYVRTDVRAFTLRATLQILGEVFPDKKLRHLNRSIPSFTQTALFDPRARPAGEVDLIFW